MDSVSQEKKKLNRCTISTRIGRAPLRLPPLKGTDGSVNTVAETYFKRGCVPLPHALRQGDQTISWYHGPLTPGRNKSRGIELPIRSADQLVRYNEDAGMLDVSYAVAWELGRLLTLQKTGVAVDLFNWKRALRPRRTVANGREIPGPFAVRKTEDGPGIARDSDSVVRRFGAAAWDTIFLPGP